MALFDEFVDDYEAACERGLLLAGESRDYFARLRVEYTRELCPDAARIRSIIDFGCGLGHTTPHLLAAFRHARVLGIDVGDKVIEAARGRYSSSRAQFMSGSPATGGFADLVYCNGVFHHVPSPERHAVASRIFSWLLTGGFLALWENNPWNPGTRLVMSRIPFDRDADTLSCRQTRTLLTSVGFRLVGSTFHFFFPAVLKALRGLEPRLRKVPLGGQYCVLATKPRSDAAPTLAE